MSTYFIIHFQKIYKHNKEATRVLIKAKSKKLKIYVPQIIIFEILFALDKYYKFPKTEVIEKIGTLLVTSYLDIEDRMVFKEALEVYNRFAKTSRSQRGDEGEVRLQSSAALNSEADVNFKKKTADSQSAEVYKSKNIDFVDCFLICKTKESKSTLFTFDENLSKLATK